MGPRGCRRDRDGRAVRDQRRRAAPRGCTDDEWRRGGDLLREILMAGRTEQDDDYERDGSLIGQTLASRYLIAARLSEAPMPPASIIHQTRQLPEGLYPAHEQGLIHRDFKPENVIVERDSHGAEVPRIVDFGIALLREGGDGPEGPGRLTTNGLVLGTPPYMAPEQAVAAPIDHRIDLFALGIIVYEMLCGKLPFAGSGAAVARASCST